MNELEYSDVQADLHADQLNSQEEMLALGYEKFIAYHNRLTRIEQDEYWSAITLDDKLKWAA